MTQRKERDMKILDYIEMHAIGRRPTPLDCASYGFGPVFNEVPPTLLRGTQMQVEGRLQVTYQQYLPERASPEAMKSAREHAHRAIARNLYGEVLDHLLDVREGLWSEAISRDAKPMKTLDGLIKKLSGEIGIFE